MKYRNLRIAWSVGWGVVCLSLIALWIRSYSQWDNICAKPNTEHYIMCRSVCGQLSVGYLGELMKTRPTFEWAIYSNPTIDNGWVTANFGPGSKSLVSLELSEQMGFNIYVNAGDREVTVPHWFLAMLTALVAAISWLPWRFSLRTLLIIMTLVAVGLGLAVYALRT
jgi:hypothetical protein